MKKVTSEDQFQDAVMDMLGTWGHVQDHRMSALPNVPDLSVASYGNDYWLELKYGQFKLGHDKYSPFKYRETTAGQLDWLTNRSRNGRSICGILGYAACGDVDFITFHTAPSYKKAVERGATIGAILLMPVSQSSRSIVKGIDLLGFTRDACRFCIRNGE